MVLEIKNPRNRMFQRKTSTAEQYSTKRRRVDRVWRKKRRHFEKRKIEDIEETGDKRTQEHSVRGLKRKKRI